MPTTPHTASENVAPYAPPTWAKAVKLFRNEPNQAVRIPKEFELPGTDALISREGNRLILEQVPEWPRKGSAAALLLAPPIGGNDTLIADHALALDATLFTADEEYRRVPRFKVENWLGPAPTGP
jgi:antitoxin VapB